MAGKQQEDIAKMKQDFLAYFRQLPLQNLAAAKIGRNDDTISIWKKEDSEFSEQIRMAKADWALKNVKEVRSKEWLLERIMRDDFSEKKIFAGDSNSDPIQIVVVSENEAHHQTIAAEDLPKPPEEAYTNTSDGQPPTPDDKQIGTSDLMAPGTPKPADFPKRHTDDDFQIVEIEDQSSTEATPN